MAATATAAVAAVANSRYLIPPLDQIDEEFDITIYLYGADGLRQQLIARLLADELSRSKEPEQVIAFIIDMAAQMMSPPAPPTLLISGELTMTSTTPFPIPEAPSREAGIAEEIRRTCAALNTQIERASEIGLRVEIDVLQLHRQTVQFPRPVVSATVTKLI